MQIEHHARLSRNGKNQLLEIPPEFELEGKEAIIRKVGSHLIVEPISKTNKLLELLETLEPIYEEFPEIEDPPVQDEEIF